MKALSLWQPWATLIAIGAKQIETRSWSTTYRGPLVIHAAKNPTYLKALEDAIYKWHTDPPIAYGVMAHAVRAIYEHVQEPIGAFLPRLPLGAALCVADLVDVVRVESVRFTLSAREYAFGDYTPGRFAWQLANVRRFAEPIPMAGKQGLFDCAISSFQEH